MSDEYSNDESNVTRSELLITVLQKAIQRNDQKNAILSACEYLNIQGSINNLKYKLMIICCEDIPNLKLIDKIYKCDKANRLLELISSMCAHTKKQEHNLGLRLVCESFDFEPISEHDTLISLLRKTFTSWCASNGNYEGIMREFERFVPSNISVISIFKLLKDIRFAAALCYYIYNPRFSSEHLVCKSVNDIMNNTIDIKKLSLNDIPEYAISTTDYQTLFEITVLTPHVESEIEAKAKQLYIETNLSYTSFIRPTDIKNEIDVSKVLFKRIKPSSKQSLSVYIGRTIDRSSIPLNKISLTNFILKGPFSNKPELISILASDKLKRTMHLKNARYTEVSINGKSYIAGSLYFAVHALKHRSNPSYSFDNVGIYKHDTHQLREDDIAKMNHEEMFALLLNLAHRYIVGCAVTKCCSFIYYHNTIASVDDKIEFASKHTLFTQELSTHIIDKLKRCLKHEFAKISEFLKKYVQTIKGMKHLPLATKIYLTKRTMLLMRRSNWIVS